MVLPLLERGINWFKDTARPKAATEPVIVRTAGQERTIENVSVVEPETIVNAAGVKVQSDKYVFLFDVQDLVGLRLARGVHLIRRGVLYEAIIDNRFLADFNDPNNTIVGLSAQMRRSSQEIRLQ